LFFRIIVNSSGVRPDKLSEARVGGQPTRQPKGMGAVTESCVHVGNDRYEA